VDEGDVRAGLRDLTSSGHAWILVRGDDKRMATTQIPFGYEPLFRGLKVSRRDMRDLMRGTAKRQKVPSNLQDLFQTILSRKGLALRKRS
jgi:hypothetical protein